MSDIDDVPAPRGILALQTMAMPKDTNATGDIFGGWLLSQMDIACLITASEVARVMAKMELVVESSKLGLRKPDPKIYQHTCNALGIEPSEAVYLDDLGINLKPARAMGMQTIKVIDPD